MYCPNCGTKGSAEQKFCRSCGLGLEKIAQSLGEQLPATLDESLDVRKNKLERMGVAALSVFGVGVLSLILYLVGYKLMFTQGRLLAGLGILAFILIAGCGILSVILFEKANEVEATKNKHRLQPSKELSKEETSPKLLPEALFEPLPSVTERTTELLFAEKKIRAKG